MRAGIQFLRCCVVPAVVGGALLGTRPTLANNTAAYQVLYSFTGINGEGAFPRAPLLQAGPMLYGTAQLGGIGNQYGTIFSFDPVTNAESTLYDFSGGSVDGQRPSGALIQSGSEFYGTALGGGTSGGGTIFSFDPATKVESTLYSFGGYAGDGYSPSGSLVQSGTVAYGVTNEGGASFGTIYKFDIATAVETVLYSFKNDSTDGIMPVGSLVLSNSTLYGVTSYGMAGQALYQFDLNTNQEKVLHFFGGTGDGNSPTGSLLLSGSKLYGLTDSGGEFGDGSLFQYNLSTGTESILYSFAGGNADGKWPEGGLAQVGPLLYGMTESGGAFADGTIFAFDTETNTESIVESLDGSLGDLANGSFTVAGNMLYGTTQSGGADNSGTIVSLSVPEPSSFFVLLGSAFLLLYRTPKCQILAPQL